MVSDSGGVPSYFGFSYQMGKVIDRAKLPVVFISRKRLNFLVSLVL